MAFALEHSYLIPLLPLLGAIVAGFAGRTLLRGQSHWPIWAGVGLAAILSFAVAFGVLGLLGADSSAQQAVGLHNPWFEWFRAGDAATGGQIVVGAGAWLDPLTAVMLCVVCGIGFLITVFAAGYMKGEAGYWRFFAYLGLFIFFMACLVMGDNLVMLYLGWEGVGLCSYLLVGYYYEKPAAREAAKKAFIVNRVGDFGFAVGILLTFYCFGTVSYFGPAIGGADGFVERFVGAVGVPADRQWALYWIPFFLMVGAFGKSAQFPLHVWLPDAMEGPTPVSALIHAATMVTAGVYMIVRCGPVFTSNQDALLVIAVIGTFTALLAGTIALRQNDLKKVFAYSTVSQLGFMFVAAAVLAPVAAVFHLVTHAFFKALLFLSSGVVMHATHGELDLRKMSGLKRLLPMTRWLCLVGCLALAGVFPLAGFWSKDEIVLAAGKQSGWLYALLTLAAFMTAYYTFRLYFRVFEGDPAATAGHGAVDPIRMKAHGAHAQGDDDRIASHSQGERHEGGHGSHEPLILIVPLAVLAVGAVLAGLLNLPSGIGLPAHKLGDFLGHSPSFQAAYEGAKLAAPDKAAALAGQFGVEHAGHGAAVVEHESHVVPLLVAFAVSLAGIALAYFLHLANRPAGDRLPRKLWTFSAVFEHRYWLDELYDAVVVGPLRVVGMIASYVDRYVVDGLVTAVAGLQVLEGAALRGITQRGYLQGYALTAVLGVAVILLVVFAT